MSAERRPPDRPEDEQAALLRRLEDLQQAVQELRARPRSTRAGPAPLTLVLLGLLLVLAWREDLGGMQSALGGAPASQARPPADGAEHPAATSGVELEEPAVARAGGGSAVAVRDPGAPDAEAMQQRLDQVVAERNELFGQVVRLRNQLVEKEQRIAALIELREAGEQAAEAAAPPDVRVSSTDEREPDPWLDAIDEALRGSGVASLRVVEGRLVDGALRQVLLAELDLLGQPKDVRHVDRLRLVSESGVVFVELLPAPAPDAEDPAAATVPELRRLVRWDPELWQPTGLALPSVMLPLEDVHAALSGLLAGLRLEIVALGGYDRGELLDVELVERDGVGALLRRMRAPRATVIADGPTLVLYDGEMVQDGETRAFYKGRHQVPLPGADHEAWRRAVGG